MPLSTWPNLANALGPPLITAGGEISVGCAKPVSYSPSWPASSRKKNRSGPPPASQPWVTLPCPALPCSGSGQAELYFGAETSAALIRRAPHPVKAHGAARSEEHTV